MTNELAGALNTNAPIHTHIHTPISLFQPAGDMHLVLDGPLSSGSALPIEPVTHRQSYHAFALIRRRP